MIRKTTISGLLFLLTAFTSPLMAQVNIVNGGGSSVEDLIREQAWVTIILKPNIRDVNLKLTGIHPKQNLINFKTFDGEPSSYILDSIKEIRVQENGVIKKSRTRHTIGGALTTDDKLLLGRANEITYALFESLQGNQALRMKAAAILAAGGNRNAVGYLEDLANGNDTPIALQASLHLYSIGEEIDEKVLQDGFISGNRRTRALSARLAGLSRNENFLKDIRDMLEDPAPDIFPDAVLAAARLGDDSKVAFIKRGLTSLTYNKSEAAVNALILLKSDNLIAELKADLDNKGGMEWFRTVRILSAYDLPEADDLLREKCLKPPSYNRIAAILLTEKGDWEGGLWLREYLKKAKNPNYEHLMYRANIAITLYGSGHIQAKTIMQELLRLKPNQVYEKGRTDDDEHNKEIVKKVQIEVCNTIGRLGDRTLLSMLTTPIASNDPEVALVASEAALMISNQSFRANLKALNPNHISKLVFFADINDQNY
jgi:HEAT repeat protein